MKFKQWWQKQGLLLNLGRDYTILDLKDIAEKAWNNATQQADQDKQADEHCALLKGCEDAKSLPYPTRIQ